MLRLCMQLKLLVVENKDLPISHTVDPAHGSQWSGGTNSQGISSHGAVIVLQEYSTFSNFGLGR